MCPMMVTGDLYTCIECFPASVLLTAGMHTSTPVTLIRYKSGWLVLAKAQFLVLTVFFYNLKIT